MSAVAEAAHLLRSIAEPRPVGDLVKAAITRAAQRTGLTTERVKALWYGETRLVRAEEMDAIRAAAGSRKAKEQSARDQAAELGALFAGVAERLRQIDPDFHRNDIAGLVDTAGALGAVDRAVAREPEGLTDDASDQGGA